jgi:hypothetical protein
MTQGKIERWHQTLKGRILLENYFLPGDLEAQIAAFVTDYNYCRYDDESIDNLTPAGGFNHPTNIRFGPDGCAYVVDYGAARDLGSDSHFVGANNGPLVQIPGTGVVWKICPTK